MVICAKQGGATSEQLAEMRRRRRRRVLYEKREGDKDANVDVKNA